MLINRIRGGKWVAIRSAFLRANPLCVTCQAKGRVSAAVELDHIVPLSKGGSDEPGNYQALCRDCHRDKTQVDLGFKFRPRIGIDGWPTV